MKIETLAAKPKWMAAGAVMALGVSLGVDVAQAADLLNQPGPAEQTAGSKQMKVDATQWKRSADKPAAAQWKVNATQMKETDAIKPAAPKTKAPAKQTDNELC